MKCPMLMYNYLPNESPTAGIHSECLQAECAWWDLENQQCYVCALGTLAANIQYLAIGEKKHD